MAKTIGDDSDELCKIPRSLRRQIVHRAVVAWDRSPETFGEEIVALNDVDEAIRNNCGGGWSIQRPTTLPWRTADFRLVVIPNLLL